MTPSYGNNFKRIYTGRLYKRDLYFCNSLQTLTILEMVEERRSIIKNVCPQLKTMCSEMGLEFQLFDLSTDLVSEQVKMDPSIAEIRRQAIQETQANSIGPNFLVSV